MHDYRLVMMRLLKTLLALMLVVVVSLSLARTSVADQGQDSTSLALTDYLHHHLLPAVGAQVTPTDEGSHTVMLYGFVATERGKSDAEKRTREYLKDSSVLITNRIRIEPELLASPANPAVSTETADTQSYLSQPAAASGQSATRNLPLPDNVGTIQEYQAQNQTNDLAYLQQQNSPMGTLMLMAPLVGGLITYAALGGFGGSPYHSPPPGYYYSPPPRWSPPPPSRGWGGHSHGRPFRHR